MNNLKSMNQRTNDNEPMNASVATSSMPSFLQSETRGAVRYLRLNRPEKRNALSHALAEALISELERAAADPTVACIVLAAAGPVFCAGADLADVKEVANQQPAARQHH